MGFIVGDWNSGQKEAGNFFHYGGYHRTPERRQLPGEKAAEIFKGNQLLCSQIIKYVQGWERKHEHEEEKNGRVRKKLKF